MLALVIQMGGGLFLVPVGASLPGFGGGAPAPGDPGYGIPTFPHPGHGLPGGGGHPGNALPIPPVNIWPPLPPDPGNPDNSLPPPPIASIPVFPGNELPGVPPGVIWPPLPPGTPTGKAVVLVAISGVGWRWTVVDTSLSAGYPLPGGPPPTAGTPLPPAAAPKK